MTDEVARLVLRDNYEQNVLLGNARVQAPAMLSVHRRLIAALESRGELDRALEFLPPRPRSSSGRPPGTGLTSPRARGAGGVLQDHASPRRCSRPTLPDDAWFTAALRRYFPTPLVDELGDRLASHPLRREIVTTWVPTTWSTAAA